jgi:hypothetical protein
LDESRDYLQYHDSTCLQTVFDFPEAIGRIESHDCLCHCDETPTPNIEWNDENIRLPSIGRTTILYISVLAGTLVPASTNIERM